MAENREKTYVADVDRSIYDIRDVEHDALRSEELRASFEAVCG